MPWDVKKRDCKQKSTGKKGTHVVVKKNRDGSTEQESCHTSDSKAQGARRARYASKNESTLREFVRAMLIESDRGGIASQRAVALRLQELRPDYEFVSNKKGQQTPDVSGKLNGETVARIEVKSAQGMKGLTTVYDKTVGADANTRFDDLARALASAVGMKIPASESAVGGLIIGLGGELGQTRPVRPDLARNLDDPAYGGYSHKLIMRQGKLHVFAPEPGDENLSDKQLHVLKRTGDGGVKAFNTVSRTPDGLSTTSAPRWWSTSGSIPTKGGISKDVGAKAAGLKNILNHFAEDSDDYFMLVDGATIYPFIVGDDPLDLASLGVPKLSVAHIDRVGLSTYGLAGPGKVRLALKMKFSPSKTL